MRSLVFYLLFILVYMNQKETYKIDFGITKKGTNWRIVNDGVMGGLSKGQKVLTENSIVFKGEVSLDNNGGFSSLRHSLENNNKIAKFEELKIRYRSSGISQAITFAVSRRWYVPNYKTSIKNTNGEWKTIRIKLTDFKKYYIGRAMNESLVTETLEEIIQIGIITDEKKYGDFEFEVDFLEFI